MKGGDRGGYDCHVTSEGERRSDVILLERKRGESEGKEDDEGEIRL